MALLYGVKAVYSYLTFPKSVGLCVCLSVQCIVAKWLIRYGCGLRQ